MGMVVRSNIMALNANRQLGMNNSQVSKNLEKLSSGFRINRAGDDASGLAISEKMKAQIKGLETASMNSQDGISLVQTAEGNLTEVHDMLNRMVELAEKSANGTMETGVEGAAGTDRQALQDEMDQLSTEIERIAKSANFNNIKLLDGTLGLNAEAVKVQSVDARQNGTFADFTIKSVGSAGVAAGVKGNYSLDFKDMKIAKGAAGDLTVNVFGTELTLTVGGSTEDINASGGDVGAQAIATAIKTKLEATSIENGGFKDTNDGNKIKFNGQEVTLTAGVNGLTMQQNTAPGSENEEITLSNSQRKIDFSFAPTTAGDTKGLIGDKRLCNTVVNAESVGAKAAQKAEVEFTLDPKGIRNGASVKIGSGTYTFRTKESGWTSASFTAANTDIDLTDYTEAELASMSDKDLIALASQRLAAASGRNTSIADWEITLDPDGTTLHADYVNAADPTMALVDTQTEIAKMLSSTLPAANAKMDITIDSNKLNLGDVITIDGQAYEFTNDASKLSTTGAKAIVVQGLGSGNVLDVNAAAKALAKEIGGTAVDGVLTIETAETKDLPAVGGKGLVLQIGDTNDSFNKMRVSLREMSTRALFNGDAIVDKNGDATLKTLADGTVSYDISSQETAGTALTSIKKVINTVSSQRAELGAIQNRLEHTINNLDVAAENMNSANSRIRDTDMAKQMMEYTKMNVLTQAAQAMLAQANQQPQSILQLLQ